MAYLSRMVNGKREYSEHDRRIKAINAKLQRMYDSLGESSDYVAVVENKIQFELNTYFRAMPGMQSSTRVTVNNRGRVFISRSNKDYAAISDLMLENALDEIEKTLKAHPLQKEVSRIKKELSGLGVPKNLKPLLGKKGRSGYTYGQIIAYNDIQQSQSNLVQQAMDYFYDMSKEEQAGELTDRNGNPLSAYPEYSEAASIAHQKKKTSSEIARIYQLAQQLDDRLTAAGAMEGDPNSPFFAQTPYQQHRSPNYHGYASTSTRKSLWEEWDKVVR